MSGKNRAPRGKSGGTDELGSRSGKGAAEAARQAQKPTTVRPAAGKVPPAPPGAARAGAADAPDAQGDQSSAEPASKRGRSVAPPANAGREPAPASARSAARPAVSKAAKKIAEPAAATVLAASPDRSEAGEAGKRKGARPRSRAPVADLRVPTGGSLASIAFEAGVAEPQAAVTVAPPARRPRSEQEEAVLEPASGPEDEIWSDDPQPTREALGQVADAQEQDIEPAARLTRGSHGDPMREAADFGSSQSLSSTDYYFRQYGAHGMRSLVAEVDDFGFDPHVDAKLKPLLDVVCQRYFRVELVGAERLPQAGRALLVANRGGTLPWDGLMLRTALANARPELSALRWLAEDSVIHYPFMGVLMNRLGAVRACPENAERLLAQDRLVAVFPEGAQGSRKLFRDRYRLQRFGRGGYVKLALKFGVPILPTAIIGAEDVNPVLSRSRWLGRLVGSDSLPITPTFPWLGLAGLFPAPVRWRIAIGEPIDLSSHGPGAADDALMVHRLNEQIRSALQALVDQGKRARGSALG